MNSVVLAACFLLPAFQSMSLAQTGSSSSAASEFEAGRRALALGDLPAAEAHLSRVLQLDPKSAAAHLNLAVIEMRRKRWQQALAELTSAEKLSPNEPGLAINRGLVYFRMGDYGAAVKPLKSALRQSPGSAQARELLGLCYFFTETYSAAATTLEPLWDTRSSDLNYLYALAVSAGKSAQTALSERAMMRLFEVGAGSAEVDMLEGRAHLYRNEDTEAVVCLKRAVAKSPRLPYAQYYLGMAYRRLDDLEKARAAFEAEIANQPDAAYAYNQLGIIDSKLGKFTEAGVEFSRAIALNPGIASAHVGLAGVYREKGKPEAALAELDAALKLEPDSQSALYQHGQLLMQLGRTKQGLAELQHVKELIRQSSDRSAEEPSGTKMMEPPPQQAKP